MNTQDRHILLWLGIGGYALMLFIIIVLSLIVAFDHYQITQVQKAQSNMAAVLLQIFHTVPQSQSL